MDYLNNKRLTEVKMMKWTYFCFDTVHLMFSLASIMSPAEGIRPDKRSLCLTKSSLIHNLDSSVFSHSQQSEFRNQLYTSP